jgi:hypothetical protein
MGTLTGTTIINGANGVREQLLDAAKVVWSDNTLLHALAEAQRTICFWKADAYTKLTNVELDPGTDQALPSDGIAIMDITENTYSGLRVKIVDFDLLNETLREWPVTDRQRDVEEYCADPRDPRRFTVSPPNDGSGEVVTLYGAIPPDMTSLSDAITLADTYENTLKLMTMASAYRKNSKRQDLAKSAALTQEARQSLGLKSQSQVAVAPKDPGGPK